MTWANYKNKTDAEKFAAILKRNDDRARFLALFIKLYAVCKLRGLRLIIENPWSGQTALKMYAPDVPAVVDMDRTRRGDFFRKPTAFWFVNLQPTHGHTYTPTPPDKIGTILRASTGKEAGLCREERSMLSPLYAHNFICDFIIGKPTKGTQLQLFNF